MKWKKGCLFSIGTFKKYFPSWLIELANMEALDTPVPRIGQSTQIMNS
jgi:hypothetical protein